jgi:hypothetical protein
MKKSISLGVSLLCVAVCSCGGDVEKLAGKHLATANEYFESGDYSAAKTEIDSIKILYPKAFKVRREGIRLLQQVELKEQERGLVYLDSVMAAKREEFKSMEAKFTLEKDTAYQRVGNYLWPTQTVERNLHRSFLRFQVDEQGVMSMTSIYCGASNIHHSTVRVTVPDGTFAETPMSNDSYETSDLGEKIEKADFRMGADGNVMGFLYVNRDKQVKVRYSGDRDYSFVMAASDMDALVNIYELSQVLSAMQQIKKEQEEANMKIAFINKRINDKQPQGEDAAK